MTMDSLLRPVAEMAREAPDRLALFVNGVTLSYRELTQWARAIAAHIPRGREGRPHRVGVLAGRSAAAYASVLGVWWRGATYAPLSPGWPEQRLIAVLTQLRLDALLVDASAARRLTPQVLAVCPTAIVPAEEMNRDAPASLLEPEPFARDDIAYILFTSGTTGSPKGVQISHGGILDHLGVIQADYAFGPDDRVSLTFELTFDPSILNMLMTWRVGASLHVVPAESLAAPVAFIRDRQLTVWNSAPTLIGLANRLGLLKPGALPSLRISIFGGDTLTVAAAQAWRRAAPNSVIDNVYGPTEATIEVLRHRLTDPPIVTPDRGAIALGFPYTGVGVAILDRDLRRLPVPEAGELAVSGSQLAAGYLDAPELTAARFPVIDGVRWYLTGDKARQDETGCFHHLGRLDDQIKIRGHRVELGEIEACLRQAAGAPEVAAVGWPIVEGSATDLAAYIAAPALDLDALRAALKAALPAHMIPSRLRVLPTLPLTPHGKLDRRALVQRLDAETAPSPTQERTSARSPPK
jgi:amino acid adenylation domain-containing protein